MMTKLTDGIKYLEKYNNVKLPLDYQGFNAFRALMNITMPYNLSDDFYKLQDEIIKTEYQNRKLIALKNLKKLADNIYLYKGDITLLKADAIVNACNSKLLGCFKPLHSCIDNAIHSYAGLQVRRDLLKIMGYQGYSEPNGKVKVTKGYNLPAKYIFHTVGPIVYENVGQQKCQDLTSCYLSCFNKAIEYDLNSIAFPCISTGIFNFPNKEACAIAYATITEALKKTTKQINVIFVVFKEEDYLLYEEEAIKHVSTIDV